MARLFPSVPPKGIQKSYFLSIYCMNSQNRNIGFRSGICSVQQSCRTGCYFRNNLMNHQIGKATIVRRPKLQNRMQFFRLCLILCLIHCLLRSPDRNPQKSTVAAQRQRNRIVAILRSPKPLHTDGCQRPNLRNIIPL